MSDFQKSNIGEGRRDRIITGATVDLACASTVFTVLFFPEMFIGKNIFLRVLLGISYTFIAFALCFGIVKLLLLLPLELSSAFLGSCILVTWCVYYVLAAFPIFPFSTSWQMVLGISFLISVTVIIISALLGVAATIRPWTTIVIILAIVAFAGIACWLAKPDIKKAKKAQIHTLLNGRANSRCSISCRHGELSMSRFFSMEAGRTSTDPNMEQRQT
jgi:hypothetical protein